MKIHTFGAIAGAVVAAATVTVVVAGNASADPPPAAIDPSGAAWQGICQHGDNSAVVCAPTRSPGGGWIVQLWDDGSAGYADGWGLDPDGNEDRNGAVWVPPGQEWRVG